MKIERVERVERVEDKVDWYSRAPGIRGHVQVNSLEIGSYAFGWRNPEKKIPKFRTSKITKFSKSEANFQKSKHFRSSRCRCTESNLECCSEQTKQIHLICDIEKEVSNGLVNCWPCCHNCSKIFTKQKRLIATLFVCLPEREKQKKTHMKVVTAKRVIEK